MIVCHSIISLPPLPVVLLVVLFCCHRWTSCEGVSLRISQTHPQSTAVVVAANDGLDGNKSEMNSSLTEARGQARPTLTAGANRRLGFENQGRGEWEPVFPLKLVPIHSQLTPAGKLLMYGTNPEGDNAGDDETSIYYEVWDVSKGAEDEAAHALFDFITDVDLFCSYMNVDASSGNIMILGGDDRTLRGVTNAHEYDYRTDEMQSHPLGGMRYGRWYATSVILPDGSILVVGGSDEERLGVAMPEVWSPQSGFRKLKKAKVRIIRKEPGTNHWWYPHVYVNSMGEVILIMPRSTSKHKAHAYKVGIEGDGTIDRIGKRPFQSDVLAPSIMFRTDRVLMLSDSGRLWVADISPPEGNSSSIRWEKKTKLGKHGRTNASMVLLPDGRVAIVGGCASTSNFGTTLSDAVRTVQIWDPDTDTILDEPEEERARLYHSTALLLPDGRVFSGGGGTPGPVTNLNGQLYSPPYLFDSNQTKISNSGSRGRLVIEDCPSNIESSGMFNITVDDSSRVSRVTATKSGGITHARNCDARWLNLDFEALSGDDEGKLQVHAEDQNVMIPGLWMVTVLNEDMVPSEARLVGVDMAPLA